MMGKTAKVTNSKNDIYGKPAMSAEDREKQLIALANQRAEQMLRDGTASSQVICHFLKEGTARAKLECAKLEHENKLLEVRAKAIESEAMVTKKIDEAMAAFKRYSGVCDDETY